MHAAHLWPSFSGSCRLNRWPIDATWGTLWSPLWTNAAKPSIFASHSHRRFCGLAFSIIRKHGSCNFAKLGCPIVLVVFIKPSLLFSLFICSFDWRHVPLWLSVSKTYPSPYFTSFRQRKIDRITCYATTHVNQVGVHTITP